MFRPPFLDKWDLKYYLPEGQVHGKPSNPKRCPECYGSGIYERSDGMQYYCATCGGDGYLR